MTIQNPQQLISVLDQNLGDVPAFTEAMGALQFGLDELQAYLHFSPTMYTRNQVHRNASYELLVLCWNQGQVSPIHDHQDQDCWMTVIDGQIDEVLYKVDCQSDQVSWQEIKTSHYQKHDAAYINDDHGWHRIKNVGSKPAVSLHLYAKPFDQCQIIDEDSRQAVSKKLKNYSELGKVLV